MKDQSRMVVSATVSEELKKLVHQSSHYLFGLIGNLALGFVSFPIFTRIFSIADYGMIDLAQKILLLVTAVSKVGLQNSALRFYDREAFSKDPSLQTRYYSTMLFGVAAAAVLTTIVYAATISSSKTLVGVPLATILIFTCALVFLRSMQSILLSFVRIEERTKGYNALGVILKASSIAVVCLLLPWLGTSVRTYFSGTMVVELALVVFLCLPLLRRGLLRPTSFDTTLFCTAFAFGVPLIVQELAGLILDAGDRLMVQHYMGGEALGFYSVAYGLATYINTLLLAPLGLAILPIYMRLWTSEGRDKTIEFLSLGLDLYLIGAIGLFVVVTVCCHDAVIVLASAKYQGADRLIPTIVAGLLLYTSQIFLNAGLLIYKRTRAMAGVLTLSAVLNLGLNWLLLPTMGLQGAALATLLSYGFCTLLLGYIAFKVLPLHIRPRAVGGYLLSAAIVWAAVSRVSLSQPFWNLTVKSILAGLSYAGILYLLDSRLRNLAGTLLRRLIERRQIDRAIAA